jgi:parallel beta-helix repeat protein
MRNQDLGCPLHGTRLRGGDGSSPSFPGRRRALPFLKPTAERARPRSHALSLLLFLIALTARGATFYCDPIQGSPQGDGSVAQPWRTLEEVIKSRLIQLYDAQGKLANPRAPVKPGDTLLLRSGWQGVIRIASGYNARPITIAAEPGQFPQVGWVEIGEGRHWLVKGLTISPSLAPTPLERPPRNLVMLGEHGGEESEDLVIEDCFVYSVLDTRAWSAQDWIHKTSSGIWLGRHGRAHVARNNYVLNTRFGINLCAPECLAEGNVIANFSGDGLRVTRDGQIAQYNIVKNVFVGAADGDANHDDGIQVFLFNAGTGTLRDVTLRGNLILAREIDGLPFPNGLQGLGCFDGPLVPFTVEKNVVCVNHYHGISLYDAQGCTIQDNACYSRWPDRAKPWIMLGQKKKQAAGNFVRNNLAHSFNFKDDADVKTENNRPVTEAEFLKKKSELTAFIEARFGKIHPVAKRPRLEPAAAK